MTEGQSERRFQVPGNLPAWTALAVVIALYVVFQVVPPLMQGGGHQNDFKHVYLGALFLAEGRSPYDAESLLMAAEAFAAEDPRFARGILPYVYLPFTGQVLRPLTWFSFGGAVVAFQLLNHVLLVAGLAAAAMAGGWKWSWKTVALVGAAAVFNFAVYRQNTAGQLNMVLVAGFAVVALGLVRRWPVPLVTFIAAFLMLFKLSPGILLIFFLITRKWRYFGWMLGWGVGLGVISMLMAGVGTTMEFLPLLAQMGFGASTWQEYGMTFWRDDFNQSPNAFFHRVMVDWPGATPWVAWAPWTANLATWACSMSVLGLMAWRLWPRAALDDAFGLRSRLALVITASLLLPSLMWDHYLVQGLVAVALLWHAPLGSQRLLWWRVGLGAIVAIWSLGFHFPSLRLHFLLIAQPLMILVGGDDSRLAGLVGALVNGVGMPQVEPLGGLLRSLKLWPTIGLFVLAVIACGWRETPEAVEEGSKP